jgi:hypothetical protein
MQRLIESILILLGFIAMLSVDSILNLIFP